MNLSLFRLASFVFATLLATSICVAQQQEDKQSQDNQQTSKADKQADKQDDKQQQKEQEEREQAREEAREKAREARDNAQENRQGTRDEAQEQREKARDKTQDQREDARDQRQDTRDELRDQRESARESRQDARESIRDDRQQMRDENRDSRQQVRDERGERVRSFFRGQNRGDLGLRFDEAGGDRLMVLDLDPNSIGARIGLRQGDVILSINGRNVRTGDEFDRTLGENANRDSAIMIERNGRRYTLQMQQSGDEQQYSDPRDATNQRRTDSDSRRGYLGVTFDPSYREFAVIREVKKNSPAEKIGLQSGDTLTHVDGQEVRSLFHALRMLAMMQPGQEFELRYDRPQHERVQVALDEWSGDSQRTFEDNDRGRDNRREDDQQNVRQQRQGNRQAQQN